MNYYRRYVGDYLRDTARLSMLEHGAYTLLLDYYYADEQPLPLDHQEIYTMVRAMRPDDRKAVDKILGLYFVRAEDGYHNGRADEELGKAMPLIDAARENGKKGGRPPKNPVGSARGTISGNPPGFDEETYGDPDGQPSNNHPPSPNLQPPTATPHPPSVNRQGKSDTARRSPLQKLAALGVPDQVAQDWLSVRKAKKAPLTDTALAELVDEAGKAGISVADAVTVCAKRSWQGFKASWDWQGNGRAAGSQSALERHNLDVAAGWLPPELRNDDAKH